MTDDPTPHWQPLTALPFIASPIDGELAARSGHPAGGARPAHVLDEATVERSLKLHTEQRDFLGVFAEQLARWRHERTSREEAKFYLTGCGIRSLDGDKDGVPCERLCR